MTLLIPTAQYFISHLNSTQLPLRPASEIGDAVMDDLCITFDNFAGEPEQLFTAKFNAIDADDLAANGLLQLIELVVMQQYFRQ